MSDIRIRNRALVLRLISTGQLVSRVDIARMTGLTKTTASKIVSDLIAEGMICETNMESPDSGMGRKPIYLDISPDSPCVCGLLIKRGFCAAILADYRCRIIAREDCVYNGAIDSDRLVEILLGLYRKLITGNRRRIVALGISSIGPVDIVGQRLANPPNFFGIADVPLSDIFTRATGLDAFMINDANAGALAEKIYGNAKELENFLYLHIMNGIGAGCILQSRIYNGDLGQSGEIGHTSINFAGPQCDCGNIGCLELYANIDNINHKIAHMRSIYPGRSLLPERDAPCTWREVIAAAAGGDYYAISALDDFCEYVSHALANAINLLDINHIIVGYESSLSQMTIESILSEKLNSRVLTAKYRKVTVVKSAFGGDAPLIGSVALITDKLFGGELTF